MQMCPDCSRDNQDGARFCAYCRAELKDLLGVGTLLQGRYEVTKVLGCGGMGAVYLGMDRRLGPRQVAVKENFDRSPAAQQQFQIEANILGQLQHENLPRVTDHFIEPSGRQYLVMDFVEGVTLEDEVNRRGRLPEKQVRDWLAQILDALIYLHNQPPPIIHRDIKPQNIVLRRDGKVILVDFGLVKLLDPRRPHTATFIRGLGTLEYAPLEQYSQGTIHTDARSDIYALGATMYHLLTAQVPASAMQRSADPRILIPPRQINPAISLELEAVLLRALGLQPHERYQSAAEMRQALVAFQTTRTTPVVPPPKKGVSEMWLAVGSLAAICLLLGFCVFANWARSAFFAPKTPTVVARATATFPTTLSATATVPSISIPSPTYAALPTHTTYSTEIRATPIPPPSYTPLPTYTPYPTQPKPTATPTLSAQEQVKAAVWRFAEVKAHADRYADDSELSTILKGDALRAQQRTISGLAQDNSHWEIELHSMSFDRIDFELDTRAVVIVTKTETGKFFNRGSREPDSGISYYRDTYQARYVVEKTGGKWYITKKGVVD